MPGRPSGPEEGAIRYLRGSYVMTQSARLLEIADVMVELRRERWALEKRNRELEIKNDWQRDLIERQAFLLRPWWKRALFFLRADEGPEERGE